jgi:hypothetical protein
VKLEALPLGEELEALARHYQHLQVEHQNASPGSSARRHLEDKLLRVRERFDRVLGEWVPAMQPVVFRGRSEVTGSLVEIRGSGDELRVEVDGSLIERVAAEKDFAATEPVVTFRLNGQEFEELFNVSDEALQALADFLDGGESPPWEYASELLADGLIDVHFALTPRGHRALASTRR